MALEYAHGAIQWANADTVGTTKTVSGLSFQPKAIRFTTVGISSATDAQSLTANENIGIGFGIDTANRRCVACFDSDAAAAHDNGVMLRDDCVVATTTGAGAAGGRMDINAINSDGFQLIVDATTISADITIFWEAWGGSDITVAVVGDIAEPAATGNQDYAATGLTSGGTDQVVMFAGCQSTAAANTGAATDGGIMFGVAKDASNQWVTVINSDDASATTDTDHYGGSGLCLGMVPVAGGTPLDAQGAFVQYNTDGFRINWTARAVTNRRYIFMALKGGSWAVGEFTVDVTTLNNTATVSGLSFQPKSISLGWCQGPEEASGTTSTAGALGFGMGSGTGSRRAMQANNRNAVADVEIATMVEYDAIGCAYDLSASTIAHLLDINAINSDGFQVIIDDADATGSTTFWYGYLAAGNAPVAAGQPTITRYGGIPGINYISSRFGRGW